MGRTKAGGQKHALDKWYTKPEVAALCLREVTPEAYDLVIEPSAGAGAFSTLLPGCLALDLEPEAPAIRRQDWFTFREARTRKILVVGNPPFGQQSTLAVAFINHAATFAQTIAFILPRSFRKESVQARLHPNLHLQRELILPVAAFTMRGEEKKLPCVFQVWEWDAHLTRAKPTLYEPLGFNFVEQTQKPHLWGQGGGGGHLLAGAFARQPLLPPSRRPPAGGRA